MDYLEDLQFQLGKPHSVIAVLGAGVSITSSGTSPSGVASWTGLLRDGVTRCAQVNPGLSPDWLARVNQDINSDDDIDLLAAAEKISSRLKSSGGEFGRWLQDTVGKLSVKNPEIIQAIAALGIPIATTNYDGLIEKVTGREAITWLQREEIQRWIHGDSDGILHLHGYWRDPRSVVLGIRSYDAVIGDEQIQVLLKSIWATQAFLFIGFGKGLADPNFGALLEWARRVFSESPYRHFRLSRASDVQSLAQQHVGDRMAVVSYGSEYGDLAPFLRGLTGGQSATLPSTPSPAPEAPVSRVAVPPQVGEDTLDLYSAERQIFGIEDTLVTRTLRMQFRSIAFDVVSRPLYVTGDANSTHAIVLEEHVSSFYQGRNEVLKMQCFDVPPSAQRLRPRSMGNDPGKDYVPENWLFYEEGNKIGQLLPSAWEGDQYYTLPPGRSSTGRVYVLAVYGGGQCFYSGSEQIWVETTDFCGLVKHLKVFFGGKLESVLFRSAYEFAGAEPLRLSRVTSARMATAVVDEKETIRYFGGLMQKYSAADSVRKVHNEQRSWTTVLKVWSELQAAKRDEWWSFELSDAKASLVITATGEFSGRRRGERPEGKSRPPASRGQRKAQKS